jgi:adenine phosphoribosyltransferase
MVKQLNRRDSAVAAAPDHRYDPAAIHARRPHSMNLKDHIRSIPDFPKPGILFYDISTLLANATAWQHCVDELADAVAPHKPELLVGIESRGFLTAAPLALKLGCGFMMVRKKGKLPGETIRHTYDLEYGTDTIEIQSDAVTDGQRLVVLDDLLATGGTAAAAVTLLRRVGADVRAAVFIVELNFLNGRDKLDLPITSLVSYDS